MKECCFHVISAQNIAPILKNQLNCKLVFAHITSDGFRLNINVLTKEAGTFLASTG